MSQTAILAGLLAIAAIFETVVSGRSEFQTGWYATLVAALVALTIATARREYRGRAGVNARAGVVLAAFGAGILGLAIVANALFAPDPRTIVAAPGQRVAVPELSGQLLFPISSGGDVQLVRSNRSPAAVGAGPLYAGSFGLRAIPRDVVAVAAANARGERLTVTQPGGGAFLSPVLLMQQTQNVAGMNVRFDSFAVPAARRLVRTVLFTPQQAAQLRGLRGAPSFAILFAVDDEMQQALPNAIRIVRDGDATSEVAGLILRGSVVPFPSVEIVPVPSLTATILGIVLTLASIAVPRLPAASD